VQILTPPTNSTKEVSSSASVQSFFTPKPKKLQNQTITAAFDAQITAQTQYEQDFAIMLLSTNMPLHMADNPSLRSFLEKYTSSFKIPTLSCLNKRILPDLFKSVTKGIIEELEVRKLTCV
jgi:hypothetical protein